MIRITKLLVERYRSIIKVNFEIDNENNIIALCGENNVGKTNTLRALNLFFKPELYDRSVDMPKIKFATGGAAIHPKISIEFFDDTNRTYVYIVRNFAKYDENATGLEGISYRKSGKKKTDKVKLNEEEILKFLKRIEFIYIESINVLMPELVEKLTTEVIDVQYNKARFSETKRKLKESYDNYVDGLIEIMNSFASDISDTFKSFKDDWSVKFDVPRNSDNFRDLISDNVRLVLDDNGSVGVDDKGAGLQRLATILLEFEMLERMKTNKQFIVCVDEPDVYLHEGLQKKLMNFFEKKSETIQFFLTTHSKVFINSYSMKNVFLLSKKVYAKPSARKGKEISVVETFLEEIKGDAGYKKICDNLGIEVNEYEPLEDNNILVEGECDKRYIEELCNFYAIKCPNIISVNGADNIVKYLEFYNSFYYSQNIKTPKVKVLLDNDSKGREVHKRIDSKKNNYHALNISCQLIQNYLGDANISLDKNSTNNEIEDFIFPEILCSLINNIMTKMKMKKLNSNKICKEIQHNSFKSKGILELCEYEKNLLNPEDGNKIAFNSSGQSTNQFKESLAKSFNLQANVDMLEELEKCSTENDFPKKFLEQLCLF